MAVMIEAQSNAFFVKCKGIAIVLAAVSGLVLGLLNWFKETKDLRAKSGYQELSKQVTALSGDVRKLSDAVKQHGEEITTIQNWIIGERRGSTVAPVITKIQTQSRTRRKFVAPPVRKAEPWEVLRIQRGPAGS